jgi:hypothetical protein
MNFLQETVRVMFAHGLVYLVYGLALSFVIVFGASRFVKITLIILTLLLAAVGALFIGPRIHEAAVWRQLSQRVPAQALSPAEAEITADAVSGRLTPDGVDEVGHVRLANGDIWRFAFRSHHLLHCSDSYSVFAGPAGIYRVRGDYFCCEVQFPSATMPKDSAEFLTFLRGVHNSVERAK